MAQRGIVWGALLALFVPSLAFADYIRTPSGDTVYQDDGFDLSYDLSGHGTGYYFSFFDSATIGDCIAVGADPEEMNTHVTAPSLGARTEILGVGYTDSGCTSYSWSASLEYDSGATIFTVVSGAGPTPPPEPDTTATSSPDSYPEILAYSIFIAIAGFLMPFLIANFIDRGY